MKIAIHQPNFFPWYPFFEKMKKADIFIVMTHCQFEKNGYQNRFNMFNRWYTMRVPKGIDLISSKSYLDAEEDWERINRRLPEFNLHIFDDCITGNIAICNLAIIKRIAEILNIKTEITNDYYTELKRTDRLVDLCKFYNADTYISGPSGKDYLEIDKFEKEGIKVEFHENRIKEPILWMLKESL